MARQPEARSHRALQTVMEHAASTLKEGGQGRVWREE